MSFKIILSFKQILLDSGSPTQNTFKSENLIRFYQKDLFCRSNLILWIVMGQWSVVKLISVGWVINSSSLKTLV